MIYQLMRRDPAWKITPWLTLLSGVAWACPPPIRTYSVMIVLMGLFGATPNRRASRFEAALPIETRDLMLSRALVLMAVIWLPALAGAAVLGMAGGWSAETVEPLMVAGLGTLLAGGLQAAWLKHLAGPQWTLILLSSVFAGAGSVLVEHPVPLISQLCALAGIALFAGAWAMVPRSFQLGSARLQAPEAARQSREGAATAAFRWAPVVRSVCSWQYVFFAIMMAFQAGAGQWQLTPFWLVIVWASTRMRIRWLWALPVGRRALLWTIIGPILAGQALGYLAGFFFHRRSAPSPEPRVVVVTLAAILGWMLVTLLFCVLIDWRGFARIPRRILTAVFVSIFGVWCVVGYLELYFAPRGSTWTRDALAQFGRTVPVGLPALVALAAALLIALYCGVEKVFREPDFADKAKVPPPDVG